MTSIHSVKKYQEGKRLSTDSDATFNISKGSDRCRIGLTGCDVLVFKVLLLFCSIHIRLDVHSQHQAGLCSFRVSSWRFTVNTLQRYHGESRFNIFSLFYKTNIGLWHHHMYVSIYVSFPPNKFLNSWFFLVLPLLPTHCRCRFKCRG